MKYPVTADNRDRVWLRLADVRAVMNGKGALLFLVVAALLFTLPLLARLAWQDWRFEGTSGPLILATGLWLLVKAMKGLPLRPGSLSLVLLILIPAVAGTAVSGIVGSVRLQWFCAYGALVAIGYGFIGASGLRALWFPLAYLLFLLPPPQWIVNGPVLVLREWLCEVGVSIMAWLGYDVAYSGALIYVSQYELFVSDACSGMNSLFGLMALGLFYAYMRHGAHWRSLLILALCTFPVAVAANLGRILLLLLATHHLGDAFAQGPFHETAGLIMFTIGLLIMLMIDGLLTWLLHRRPV